MQEFKEIWCLDFEFQAPSGEQVNPICMVAIELKSGKKLRIFQKELKSLKIQKRH